MTLVEVLVALAILGFGLVGVARLQAWLLASAAESRQLNQALARAQQALETRQAGSALPPGITWDAAPAPFPGLSGGRVEVRWPGPTGRHQLQLDAVDLASDPQANAGLLDGLPPAMQ